MLWRPSSLAFRRGFTRHTLLRDILGLRNHTRRLDEHLGESSAERTLGGLPLFLFSPAAGATSDVEAAVPAALFLFLLPLGRPRPRFAGVDARPAGGTRRTVSTHRRVSSSIIAEQGHREREKGGGGRTDPCLSSPPAEHPPRARRAVCDHQRCRRLESQTWWMGKEGRYGDC